ncbi:MAG TPA: hypothetical protein VIJ94_08770 [Caulobacteraceae bacterium]
MLKQRRLAADQVAAGLFEAEAAIDAALNKTAFLAAVIPAARAGAGLSALFGQDALERLSETIAALAQARRGIVETHKELSVVKTQIGLGSVVMDGDNGEKPPQGALVRPNLTPVRNNSVAA